MIPKRTILGLLVGALLLPIAILLLLVVSKLVGAMGDAGGALFLGRTGIVVAVLWALDTICLVVALAINTLGGPDEPEEM